MKVARYKKNIRDNFKEILSYCNHNKSEIESVGLIDTLGILTNPRDMLAMVDDATNSTIAARFKPIRTSCIVKMAFQKGCRENTGGASAGR